MILMCKICSGKPRIGKCMFCGAKKPKNKQEESEVDNYHDDLKRMFLALKRGQSQGTGLPEVDAEIRKVFGEWLQEPAPLYTSQIMQLYGEAHHLETVVKNKKKARIAYMRLYNMMQPADRIHYRITKNDIQRKIQELRK